MTDNTLAARPTERTDPLSPTRTLSPAKPLSPGETPNPSDPPGRPASGRSIVTPDRLQRVRRALRSTFGLTLKVVTFLTIALVGGIASSWYVTNQGAAFNTVRHGPWVRWTYSGGLEADPYSLIRYNRLSTLVYNTAFVTRYEATFDDQMRRLHSSCHYLLTAKFPSGLWWSLNVYDDNGLLIPNPAQRFGFNAATAVRSSDGSVQVNLARDARPGNWVPTSRAGRLAIILEIQNRAGGIASPDNSNPIELPSIERISCR